MEIEQQLLRRFTLEDFRQKYLKYLTEEVSYNGGRTTQTRVRHPGNWKKIPFTEPTFEIEGEKVWVWSDLHFGHKNIIDFSDRPYPNIPTMNEHLVLNFNDYVDRNDVSIWVGDVAFLQDSEANRLLKRCNGYKILVIGNHDFHKGKLKKLAFDEVHLTYVYQNPAVNLVFTHYPMPVPQDWINVHGHEHVHTAKISQFGRSLNHINVCCELHQYKPLDFDVIKKWAERRYLSIEWDDKL